MFEEIVWGETLAEAYHNALWNLRDFGDTVPCPDYNTTQQEVSMTMCVVQPLREPMISRCFIGGPRELEQYRQEMLDGILDFEVERGNWPYTYHQRMAAQIPLVIAELRRNPDTRRAVIDVRDWGRDLGSDDPACLQNIQYFIRNGELHCKVLFRSNDACKAAFMNAFALIMLQKRIADELGVPVGTYVHRANSFHCYEKDLPLLEGYVERIKNADNVTYNYVGEWDELMEEAKPDIERMVCELRGSGDG
jgi:thymidylate synthase